MILIFVTIANEIEVNGGVVPAVSHLDDTDVEATEWILSIPYPPDLISEVWGGPNVPATMMISESIQVIKAEATQAPGLERRRPSNVSAEGGGQRVSALVYSSTDTSPSHVTKAVKMMTIVRRHGVS